jgi:hypothetical protein
VGNKKLWILGGLVVILIAAFLLISGLTGWVFSSERVFNVPGGLVAYNTIVNDYAVKTDGLVSEKQVREIFTILKNVHDNFNKLWNENYPIKMVQLEGMTLSKTENGSIRVEMNEWDPAISAVGNGQTLELKRTWMGKWVLVENKDPYSPE